MKPLEISIKWPRSGTARTGHTASAKIVNERRGITADTALRLGTSLRHERRFLDEYSEDYELLLTRRKY